MTVLEQYAKSPSWTPRQELRQPVFWKSIRAEFVGSLILMIFSTNADPCIGPVCYGCTVAVLMYSFRFTRSYFNPMITMAALLLRSVTPFRCCSIVLAQTMGKKVFPRLFFHNQKNYIYFSLHSFIDRNSIRCNNS